MASTYRWTSGREPFLLFAVRRKCVISVRMRCCDVDEEEEKFARSNSSALSDVDSHRSEVDFATEAGSLPAFRCSIDSLSAALRHIVPRISKSVNATKGSSTFATYTLDICWRARHRYVLRDVSVTRMPEKHVASIDIRLAARTPTRDFYI